jgi:hypothetical protein
MLDEITLTNGWSDFDPSPDGKRLCGAARGVGPCR